MDDRVGDVLAQRSALEGGVSAAVALSLLLHGGMTGVAIWIARRTPPPEPVSTVNIQFAPMREVRPSAPAPKPVAAKPIEQTPKPVETPKIIQPPAPPAPKTAVTKPEPKTVPLSPFGTSTKKGSERPAPPPAPAAPAAPVAGVGTIEVPAGGSGVTGLEGGDFPYTLYINRMHSLIGAQWIRPQVGAGIGCTVYFVIERDGKIRDAKIEAPSGNGTFDRNALRAVLQASPLPSLPYAYNGTYLGVHLTFK